MSVAVPVIESFDGANRRIYLKQGVDTFHWIEDIYREYIRERRTNEAFRKWKPLMKQSGNEPKGGNKYTPRYITLLAGARVIPYDENILMTVTGEGITDNADVDPDPFDTSTRTQPLKLYITPPAAEIVRADGEIAVILEILENPITLADAVWAHSTGVKVALDAAFSAGIEGGRWKIENNQMIFYESDNVTEIARFDLKDGNGLPTESNAMERVRA